eukprot:gnl/MRDRNA2_/MRDRNA2_95989_c0_seq1.p1 gnl/MRDRNA2_/MRDRNA2_95989_c0~~gnl/MRDRNA2_/MRDRNA2_95989_c0_seq1.p1  ORF type:complete len:335 (-),score=93.53 gnl/MRDRNA2_/MRDRNA2_95989_c0_seq1:61-1065(-)
MEESRKKKLEFVDTHLATGWASTDDERKKKSRRSTYGQLYGDKEKPGYTKEEALQYQLRQAGAPGAKSQKVRFKDSVNEGNWRSTAWERHETLCSWLTRKPTSAAAAGAALKSDWQHLKEAHRFLRSEQDDDGTWEAKIAKRYYDRLFKEYVVCELAGYKKGQIGFRWRTEPEVYQGKGQFRCAQKRCESKLGLRSYEVDFKYQEAGQNKRCLVKVRLCEKCAYKLHYRKLKAERKEEKKRRKREKKYGKPKVKRSKSEEASSSSVKKEDKLKDEDDDKKEVKEESVSESDRESDGEPDEAQRRRLEALAWKGEDPEHQTREDEFDAYFRDLLG